jgi:hypothetical protein
MGQIFTDPAITAIVMAMSIPIVGLIAFFWYEVRKTQSNNRLKRDMLDRGMSPADIERVINAGAEANTCEKPSSRVLD